ncbi:MAG TPA: ATP-dependent DNA helicase RecG [Acidimicrobiales bacterium]|nr:ATP-dependent DNA helicase RecG [Acidimicrobiales bacterium]
MSGRLALLDEIAVGELRGVGPRKADALEAVGVRTLLDLVMCYPRRYADRTAIGRIAELAEGEESSVHATVLRCAVRRLRGRRSMAEVSLEDGSGPVLVATFFNQPWRASQLGAGTRVVVNGRVSRFRGRLQMTNPRVDVVARPGSAPLNGQAELSAAGSAPDVAPAPRAVARQTGRIVPIYPQSERAGLASYEIEAFVAAALERAASEGAFEDPLSDRRRRELDLVSRDEAFREIHAPSSMPARARARRRLAFDELWRLQVSLVMRKQATMAASRGIRHSVDGALVRAFVERLPFALTSAQERAIAEVAHDLAGPYPMHRLLQGDVGAGKTVVAIATLLFGVQGGFQGAFMVPTEVLAEQHVLAARRLLEGLVVDDARRLGGSRDVAVGLLTSRTPAAERDRIVTALGRGELDLLVGTHALLTEDVRFSSLGIVVVDEQHRFGVDQRAALREKGAGAHDPDLLVMTATPIPRTAAMTVYGDLDATVLDELPPGREAIETRWVAEPGGEAAIWESVRAAVARGEQAYVICPLVRPGEAPEDPEDLDDLETLADTGDPEMLADTGDPEMLADLDDPAGDGSRRPGVGTEDPAGDRDTAGPRGTGGPRVLRSAVEEHERLTTGELSTCRVGLLHGQLRPSEKDAAMAGFREGRIDVLVATTVVEVGVDVPGATVMVVADADRFGIAQLHQLRGRVGRGRARSACYLLAPDLGDTVAAERLRALEATTDGFELAEIDLALRGEGTVLGARQQGRNDLRLASLRSDRDLVELARALAESVLDTDPGLERHPVFAQELRLFVGDDEARYLFRS